MRNKKLSATTLLSKHPVIAYAHPDFKTAYFIKILYLQQHNYHSPAAAIGVLKSQSNLQALQYENWKYEDWNRVQNMTFGK